MATVKLPKAERMKLMDAVNNKEAVSLKISSRMVVDPDEGVNGSVMLPLTKTQIEKLNKSQRATNFNLSKTQINKLIKGGGFFGSLWSGVKKVGSTVGKTALAVGQKVGSKVLDVAVDKAIEAAPTLLMGAGNPEPVRPKGRLVRGTLGVAKYRGTQGLGIGDGPFGSGGAGGDKGSAGGVMRVLKSTPYPKLLPEGRFVISDM